MIGRAERVASGRDQADDPALQRAQARAESLTRQVNACPLLSGVAVKDVAFTGFVWRQVEHGLGRAPEGFLVTHNKLNAASGAGSSTRIPTTRNATQHTIEMISDVTCFLDLWFF